MTSWMLLVGGLAGLGLSLAVAALVPARAPLTDALRRLSGRGQPVVPPGAGTAGPIERAIGPSLAQLLHPLLRLRTPTEDLRLLGRSPEEYHARQAALMAIGLFSPGLLVAAASLGGLRVPVVVPAALGLLAAVLCWLGVDAGLRAEAARARAEFRAGLETYFRLVAQARMSGAGVTEALEVACENAQGWVFRRIRDRVLSAPLEGVSPWVALAELGEQMQVRELDDLSRLMAAASDEGRKVHEALRAKADALEDATATAELEVANQNSEKLAMPVSLLALAFMILVLVPAVLSIK